MQKLSYDDLSVIFRNWETIKAAKELSGDTKYDVQVIVSFGVQRRAAGIFESVENLTRGVNNIAQGQLNLVYREGDKQRIGSFNIGQIKEISRPNPELLTSAKQELEKNNPNAGAKPSAIRRSH